MRAIAAAIALAGLLSACTLRHTFPTEALQKQVAAAFPIEKAAGLWSVRLSDPVLRLDAEQGRVGLDVALTAAGLVPTGDGLGLRTLSGRAAVEGRVEYAAGAFHLREPAVTRIAFEGAAPDVQSALEIGATAAIKLALRDRPIFVLDPSRSEREAQIRRHVDRVLVAPDGLVVEFHL